MILTKLEGYVIGAAAAAAIAVGGLAYVSHLQHATAAAKVEAAVQRATATVSAGQTAAQIDASAIADRGAQRGLRLAATHEEHAHALQAAPGAGQALDPGFVQRLNDGLCEYAAYADDPGCAGLLGGDPGQLPQAGPADPPT